MKYQVYIHTSTSGGFEIINISEEKLSIIVEAYKNGNDTFTLSGEKYYIKGLDTLKIFVTDDELDVNKFKQLLDQRGLLMRSFLGRTYFSPDCFKLVGKDVTDDMIGDSEYGSLKSSKLTGYFINQNRLEELKKISNAKFDLTRLIQLCYEINDNYHNKNFLSIGMIGRTIINHIPPIFGLPNFEQVVQNYGAPKENKSFKKNMENLQNSLKNISDRFLHQQIRDKETLPNETQIDFRQDLDVLLEEIVRLLK